jgi:hypothetical protein
MFVRDDELGIDPTIVETGHGQVRQSQNREVE